MHRACVEVHIHHSLRCAEACKREGSTFNDEFLKLIVGENGTVDSSTCQLDGGVSR